MKNNPLIPLFFWLVLAVLICLPGLWLGIPATGLFSGEWVLLGLFLMLIPPKRPKLWVGFSITLLVLVLTVEGFALVSWQLYRVTPNMYHDWALLNEVFPLFISELSLGKLSSYWLLILGGIVGLILVWWLVRTGVRRMSLWRERTQLAKRVVVCTVLAMLGMSMLGLIHWSSIKIGQNYRESVQLYQDVHSSVDTLTLKEGWEDSLRRTPNIYLIFLESYGKVLATDSVLQAPYASLLGKMETSLEGGNWQMRSTWSISPILGGRSWLAFTSFLTGKKIYAHPQFTALLDRYPDYPHLVRFLNDKGYYSLRLNTLRAASKAAMIPYDTYDRFYAFDDWLRHPDFPYDGPGYGKFGNLPDQFALGYAREEVIRDQQPFFLFFITLNSHSPWNDVPVLAQSWRQLEQMPDTAQAGKDASVMAGLARDKYWRAMEYELKMMEQLILQQGDSNSLFIFLGDHQPPFLPKPGDDFATPVHFVSQDPQLLQLLTESGFESGLQLDPSASINWRHEDFFPLLKRLLQQP